MVWIRRNVFDTRVYYYYCTVYEPFLGSLSTLLNALLIGRRAPYANLQIHEFFSKNFIRLEWYIDRRGIAINFEAMSAETRNCKLVSIKTLERYFENSTKLVQSVLIRINRRSDEAVFQRTPRLILFVFNSRVYHCYRYASIYSRSVNCANWITLGVPGA